MYYLKSILVWLGSVIIGSLTINISLNLFTAESFASNIKDIGDYLALSGGYMVVSGLLSIPALVFMLVIRYNNKINDLSYSKSVKNITWAHVFISLLTFLPLFVLGYMDGNDALQFTIVCFLNYSIIGHILWLWGERRESLRTTPSLIR
ncbi:MAG: hypothetical protein N4A46_16980 [Schleiferiaceae bacterium]|jgi:hypothetical protein|nr:hypothetical protein [Schleiferiaceae bacterium]